VLKDDENCVNPLFFRWASEQKLASASKLMKPLARLVGEWH
jgi:hypothetical protein